MGLLAIPSHVWPVDDNVSAVVLLIGLAVGVDYSLFYLKREREERAAGRSESAALEAAAATSGRAVLISGLTVMAAMAGMFLTGDKTFGSFAMATIIVVAIAVLGSLTVLPGAALAPRRPRRTGRACRSSTACSGRAAAASGAGSSTASCAGPLVSVVVSAGILVALALPALGMKTVVPGAEALPKDLEAVQVYDRLQKAFPGEAGPGRRRGQGALDRRAARRGGDRATPRSARSRAGRSTSRSRSTSTGPDGRADRAPDRRHRQRRGLVRGRSRPFATRSFPQTVGSLDGVEAGVTGSTAMLEGLRATRCAARRRSCSRSCSRFAFLLLLVAFRSIVIAVKAIVLNLLSVAAAFGVLVLVFQHGWAKGLLGFDYTGGVMAWLPVFLFVILFGLSMDYHVFILSRIREAYDGGMTTEDAIAHGIKTTAGVVTSAAIVMVCVFSIFGTLSLIMMKQFGVGLATAVLIDATIVRGVLLPATMKLLGDWNWYLPRWLGWLPTDQARGRAAARARRLVDGDDDPSRGSRRRSSRRDTYRALLFYLARLVLGSSASRC